MIALNVVLMAVAAVLLAGVLTWAISSDRRSKRASGGPVHPSQAPLQENLMMPREMRGRRVANFRRRRSGSRSA